MIKSWMFKPLTSALEYEDLIPTMTANDEPSPVVVSASSESGGAVFNAFDDVTNNWWWLSGNDGTEPQWIKMDLGSGNSASVNSYYMTSSFNNATYPGMPKDWTLEGSNDDSNWTVIDTRADQTSWGNSATRTFTLASDSSYYRYLKFNMTHKEVSGYGWQIYRIQLIGVSG